MSYHQELCSLADSLGLQHATHKTSISALAVSSEIEVLFLLSVPNSFKSALLASSQLLVYTPLHEHFGIVPLEAMLAETPVLAANEGGPTETVVDGETGWLRDVSKPDEWTEVMSIALDPKNQKKLEKMGIRGHQRVVQEFSKEKMASRLENEIQSMLESREIPILSPRAVSLAFGFVGVSIAMVWVLVQSILA